MYMKHTAMNAFAVAYVIVALSGCASHDNLVRCDGRLQPINTPVPGAAQTEPAGSREVAEARSDRE
jgi:hypothetical protein